MRLGAGELAHCLRASVEDLNWFTAPTCSSQPLVTAVGGYPMPSFRSPPAPGMHAGGYTHSSKQNTHTYF